VKEEKTVAELRAMRVGVPPPRRTVVYCERWWQWHSVEVRVLGFL
jgi:hypothetical protein